MRCPKCAYISFDHFASCSQCESDLTAAAGLFRGTATDAEVPFFLGSVVSSLFADDQDLAGLSHVGGGQATEDEIGFTLGAGFEDEGELSDLGIDDADVDFDMDAGEDAAEQEVSLDLSADEDETVDLEFDSGVETETDETAPLDLLAEEDEGVDFQLDADPGPAEAGLAAAPETDAVTENEPAVDALGEPDDDDEFDLESMFESEETEEDLPDVELAAEPEVAASEAVADEPPVATLGGIDDDDDFDMESMFAAEDSGEEPEAEADFQLGGDFESDQDDDPSAEVLGIDTDTDIKIDETGLTGISAAGDEAVPDLSFDSDDEEYDFSALGAMDLDEEPGAMELSGLDEPEDEPAEFTIEAGDDADEAETAGKKPVQESGLELTLELDSSEDLGAGAVKTVERADIPDIGLKLEIEDE